MKDFLSFLFLPLVVSAFHTPENKSGSLPYGRLLKAILPGSLPKVAETNESFSKHNLQWWHSLNRNNTINCTCGKWEKTNASETWADEGIQSLNVYRWSVSLVSPGQAYAYCGGSLINDRYVLTAASCVDGSIASGVEVLVGTWPGAHVIRDVDNPDALNLHSMIRMRVHRVILHPKYSSDHLDHNIALLRLRGPVPTFAAENGVSHVCLPVIQDHNHNQYDGSNSSSLLWRFYTDSEEILPVKRTEVESQVLSKEECKGYNYSKEWSEMPDTMMCARMEKPTLITPYSDSYDCPGDAGGPLLATVAGRKVQVGIDSWTACHGRPKGVGVYTRLTEFMPWIKLHTAKDGRNCAY